MAFFFFDYLIVLPLLIAVGILLRFLSLKFDAHFLHSDLLLPEIESIDNVLSAFWVVSLLIIDESMVDVYFFRSLLALNQIKFAIFVVISLHIDVQVVYILLLLLESDENPGLFLDNFASELLFSLRLFLLQVFYEFELLFLWVIKLVS